MDRKNLKAQWKPQGLKRSGWYKWGQMAGGCGSASVPRRVDWRINLNVPCIKSSKADLNNVCDQLLLWLCLCKQTGKIKTGLNAVPLIAMRVILGRKIVIQGKPQCSVVGIGLVQLTVFKVCLHLEVETGFVTLPEMLNLQARRIHQIVTVKCHTSKGLATGCLPKRQPCKLRDWFVGCCVN